ncbi:hypothetical protein DFJ77DRAFT_511389 [Powellomyces hirtus]|nr:hypothetical protein DFJ77DRAFT_511389 [Powellomyces hirtus]
MTNSPSSVSSGGVETSSGSSGITNVWNQTLNFLGFAKPSPPTTPPPEPTPAAFNSAPNTTSREPYEIDEKVWENPYHPLPGPPETPADRAKLAQIIQEERATVASSIAAKRNNKSLEVAAKANCADLEFTYIKCLSYGPWMERATLCQKQKIAFWNCVKIQKQNLELLGYDRKSLTMREKAIIADEADQAYLKAMAMEAEAPSEAKA